MCILICLPSKQLATTAGSSTNTATRFQAGSSRLPVFDTTQNLATLAQGEPKNVQAEEKLFILTMLAHEYIHFHIRIRRNGNRKNQRGFWRFNIRQNDISYMLCQKVFYWLMRTWMIIWNHEPGGRSNPRTCLGSKVGRVCIDCNDRLSRASVSLTK